MSDVLLDLANAYRQAVGDRNADALLALYDPGVRVFDAWDVWMHANRNAWGSTVQDWFGSLGQERVQVAFDDVQSRRQGDMGMLSAVVTYASLDAHGQQQHALQNRLTWVVDLSNGARIVHEHTSAPIDFASKRAVLRRDRGAAG